MATKTSTSRSDQLLAALGAGEELTDAEIVIRMQPLHRGQVVPARVRLEKLGLVELAGQNEAGHKKWRRTPTERVAEAKAEAAVRRKPLGKKLAGRGVNERVQAVAELLEDEQVNRELREQMERARSWRAARARAQEAHAETEAQRRERKRELRKAEQEKSAYLNLLKVHDGLRESVNVLLDIRTFIREELDRQERGGELRIPMDRWPEVAMNVAEVLMVSGGVWFDLASAAGQDPEHCPLCKARTKREPRALEAGGIIDAEVVADDGADVQDMELPDDGEDG
jgi:hypothetical protein